MVHSEQWTVPGTPEEVSGVRRAAFGFAQRQGVGEPPLHSLHLALAEALANAATHAFEPDRPGSVSVELDVDWDAGRVDVRIRDDGRGIAPRADSPGLGIGMPLMARLADELEFGSQGPGCGTEVAMTFRLHALPIGAGAGA